MEDGMQTLDKLKKKHEYLTPEIAEQAGVSRSLFYKFIHKNDWDQVGHGVYASKGTWIDELYLLYQRCPQLVFSHDEAFYHYGLSEREPMVHTLTIYSGYNVHRLVADGKCKVYRVKKELLEIGKTFVQDYCGNEIPMYDLERTICDLFRSRNSIEIQEFNAVLKAYLARKDKDLNKLMEYSKLFHIKNIIQKYMQVLL